MDRIVLVEAARETAADRWWARRGISTGGFSIVLLLTAAMAACVPSKSGIEPVGDWKSVQSGTFQSRTWQLFQARNKGSGQCLAVQTDPPLKSQEGFPSTYQGKIASCGFDYRFRARYLDAFVEPELADGIDALEGVTAPSVAEVRAIFADTTQLLDTKGGYVALLFSVQAKLQALEPVDASGKVLAHCAGTPIHDIAMTFRC